MVVVGRGLDVERSLGLGLFLFRMRAFFINTHVFDDYQDHAGIC